MNASPNARHARRAGMQSQTCHASRVLWLIQLTRTVRQGTAARDGSHLAPLSPGGVDVRAVDLGTVVDAVAVPGGPAYARTLQDCYLDFACVGAAITAF